MSRIIYDNWERLVGATLKREHFYQLCYADSISRSPSSSSLTSSDFSFPSPTSIIAIHPSPISSPFQSITDDTSGLPIKVSTDFVFTGPLRLSTTTTSKPVICRIGNYYSPPKNKRNPFHRTGQNSQSLSPRRREWNVRRPSGRTWAEVNASAKLESDCQILTQLNEVTEEEVLSEDRDLVYISDILRASSPSSLDDSLFLLLEKQKYQDTSKVSMLQRKLIFDAIIEILHQNNKVPAWKAFLNWRNNYNVTEPSSYDQVCSEILRLRERESSGDLFQIVDCAMKKELANDDITGWEIVQWRCRRGSWSYYS